MATRFRSVAGVSAILATALGVSALACLTGSEALPDADAGAGTPDVGPPDDATADVGADSAVDAAPPSDPRCPDPQPRFVEGQDTGFVRCANGATHRTRAADCPVVAGDAGVEGGCVSDSDCPSATLCECGDGGGSCVPASCTTDTLCAAGGLCVDGHEIAGCVTRRFFSCQTVADECVGDRDCPRVDGGGTLCLVGDGGARSCGYEPGCVGRPFLVDGFARVAPLASTRAWLAEGVHPDVSRLTTHEREEVAAHYNRAGQLEHASIAAFARFAMELLALGAPAHLLEGTHEAMADETEHAKLTFALATAYLGAPSGPGPLAMDGALGPCTAQRVFATLVREGCIGETLAAVEATEALARATDPSVRAVLARIAADEAEHAALAWRAAQWLVETQDTSFRSWATEEVARAVTERRTHAPHSSGAALDLEAHGVLSGATLQVLADATLQDVVEPCAHALLKRAQSLGSVTSGGSALLRRSAR